MEYQNKEMTVNELISSFNEDRIVLIPPFQRNTVWSLKRRQKMIVSMLDGRPIPAIFFYREASGPQFVYNILDGKQRLETLLLFIGDKRRGLTIKNVDDYFYAKPAKKKEMNFEVEFDGKRTSFRNLGDEPVRRFRDSRIATIQISMEEEQTSLAELVSLFVDINSEGTPVTRFDMVKALLADESHKSPLFQQVFDLVASRQERRDKKSKFYKAKNTSFVFVMKRLNIVTRLHDPNMRVDRMWERLTEFALFTQSKRYRAPAEILKAFIKAPPKGDQMPRLNKAQLTSLRDTFDYLKTAYAQVPGFMQSKFATDQPQFYTVVTLLLSTDTMERLTARQFAKKLLENQSILFEDAAVPTEMQPDIDAYKEASTKQTTHPARRETRHNTILKLLGMERQRK
jgi:Protein of unknown function DUF262